MSGQSSEKRKQVKEADATIIPVLVVSCDRYADLWRPFFQVFRKQWPDCPFSLYLGSNHKVFNEQGVKTITVGNDISWASGLQKMLDRIDSEYFILFLEDFLIRQPVNTEHIQKLVAAAIERNVGCLRLAAGLPLAFPPSEPVAGINGVGVIHKSEPYRVSAQVALWRKETLKKLLIPGMNAWEFEEIGTPLSAELEEPFWGVYEPAIVYSQCVEKGKWKPEGLEICREAGVSVNLEVRGAFSAEELERHFRLVAEKSQPRMQMQCAINSFTEGQPFVGLKSIFRLIKTSPFDINLWGVLLIGLVYPSLFPTLRRYKLKRRLARIKNRIKKKEASG